MLKDFDKEHERKKRSVDTNNPDQETEMEMERFVLKLPYLGKQWESGESIDTNTFPKPQEESKHQVGVHNKTTL